MILDNVLSESNLDILRRQAQGTFKSLYPFYCAQPHYQSSNILSNVMSRALGRPLKEIVSFLRKNTSSLDTKFRVHADGEPLRDGRLCKVAGIFYLEEDDSGTALYRSPIHGDHAVDRFIFEDDDGTWEAYFKCPSKANRLFIYDANLFHGRYPWRVNTDRVVLTKFMI